jgi:hypothetical protein
MSKYIGQSLESNSQKDGLDPPKVIDLKDYKNHVRNSLVSTTKVDMTKTLKFKTDPVTHQQTVKQNQPFMRRGTFAVSRNIKPLEVVEEQADFQNSIIASQQFPVPTKGNDQDIKQSVGKLTEGSLLINSYDYQRTSNHKTAEKHSLNFKNDEFLPKIKVVDQSYDVSLSGLKVPYEKSKERLNISNEAIESRSESVPKTSILDTFINKQKKKWKTGMLNHSVDATYSKGSGHTSTSFRDRSTVKPDRFQHLLQIEPEIIQKSLQEDKRIIKYKGTLCVLDRPLYKKMLQSLEKNKLKTKPEWNRPPILT